MISQVGKLNADAGSITTTIKNTLTPTDFEFGKIWKDLSGTETAWGEGASIEVTFGRKINGTIDKDYTYTYTITKTADGFTFAKSDGSPAITALENGKFKISGLVKQGVVRKAKFHVLNDDESGDWQYYVTETQVNGYKAPSYAMQDKTTKISGNDKDIALNNEYIVNALEASYELPSTGGIGTNIFYILGSILILGAGLLMWRRRRLN